MRRQDAMADAPLILADFLPYRFSVAAERISRAFADRYEAAFGIGIHEWRVLAVLGERAPRTTRAVIAATAMDRVRVSRAAIRLDQKGLIARDGVAGDARAHVLRLTPRGREVYRRIVPMARDLQAELTARLTAEERAVLERVLEKLARAGGSGSGNF